MEPLCCLSAGPDDFEKIRSLYQLVTADLIKKGIDQWNDEYPSPELLSEDIAKGQMQLVIARGMPVAAYTVDDGEPDEDTAPLWPPTDLPVRALHRLCVHPDWQNRGIASRILSHIEKDLRLQGTKLFRLEVFCKNPAALRLYDRAGFRRVGEIDWPPGRFFLMEKAL